MSTIVFVLGCVALVMIIFWAIKSSKSGNLSAEKGFFALKSTDEDSSGSDK